MRIIGGDEKPICLTCGTQFPVPSDHCPICEDPRQFVGWDGQQWTTLKSMRVQYENKFTQDEAGVISILTEPKFAIGQRAQILQTAEGNLLWDCISLLDEATIQHAQSIGGISAIAVSHPHYYATMVEWSHTFGDIPIHLHEDCRRWVMHPDRNIQFWAGEKKELFGGLTLIHTPGHFKGFQVLHSREHGEGRGALFAGDQPRVCMDRRWVTFMFSYPNFIPLSPAAVRDILQRLDRFSFDRLYGAVPGWIVATGADEAVKRSANRYLDAIGR
jgi:glyoxylase-like metal-dependent hydrolase (beta-lactamase superfamily II)